MSGLLPSGSGSFAPVICMGLILGLPDTARALNRVA